MAKAGQHSRSCRAAKKLGDEQGGKQTITKDSYMAGGGGGSEGEEDVALARMAWMGPGRKGGMKT